MRVLGVMQCRDKDYAVVCFSGGYRRIFKLATILEDVRRENFCTKENYEVICFGVACINGEIFPS